MLLARELPQVSVPEQFLPIDINAARMNIEKAAYHGFAKAQVKMGAAYELGQLGCDFNPALSLHYNALAARQGEAEAEMAISKWFLCGHEGLFEKNDEVAFTYAQRAAQSGLPTAEFALGYFYEVGIHVPVDIQEARKWYAKAAASGNKDAAGRIDSISRSKTLSRKDHEQVAIARIKSQYGNGGRVRPSYGERQAQAQAQAHAASMAAPQEALEMPDPSRMRISDDGYAAPYPSNGQGYGPGPRPYGSPQMADARPSSAFGINPNINPGMHSPGSPGYNRVPSAGPGPMGYRQGPGPGPGPGPNSPQMQPGPVDAHGGAPRLDIGYSAPVDRRRLQRPDAQGGGGGPVPRDRMSRSPQPGHPPRNASMPSPNSGRPSPASTPRPGGGPPGPGGAPGGPSSKANTAPAPSKQSGGLPGKGPKTFEEMGVPQAKHDSECVSSTPFCINEGSEWLLIVDRF